MITREFYIGQRIRIRRNVYGTIRHVTRHTIMVALDDGRLKLFTVNDLGEG